MKALLHMERLLKLKKFYEAISCFNKHLESYANNQEICDARKDAINNLKKYNEINQKNGKAL